MESLTPFRLFGRFIRGRRRYFVAALVATAVNIILMFLAPQVVRFTVDGLIGQEMGVLPEIFRFIYALSLLQALALSAFGIVLCIALAGLFSYVSRMNLGRGTEGTIENLRNTLFAHVQRLPFKWHVDTLTGDIIQRCTSDVEVLHRFLSTQMVEALRTILLIATATVLMFSMHVPLALFAFAFVPIILLYSFLFYKRIAKKFHKADVAEGALMVRVQENLTGVRVVKAFGRAEFEMEKFHEKNNAYAKSWIDLGYLLGAYWGVGEFVTGLQSMGVVILGAYFAVTGDLTLGALIAFVSYTQILTWPIRSLGRTLAEMSQAGVSAGRLMQILDEKPEEEPKEAKKPDIKGDIVFEKVSFSYRDTAVLRDLDFTIPQGGVFGILGSTGAGKSTITYLLTRLYDLAEDGGKITIGGVDLREIDRQHLRRQVGLVLQEPFLFSKTIGENIAIAKEEAAQSAIRKVAQVADVDEDIMGFAKHYDTMVGERGVTLSGGQKQRVAIARTLLLGAPIMIFDDSLSAVDMETDAKIQAALRENTGGSTVILISHRISTLMHADQILVLDGGRQVEMGNHKSLLEMGGIYSRVYTLQSKEGERE